MAVPRPQHLRRTPITEIAALVGAPDPHSAAVVTGVTLDSRAVLPGDLYAALPGAHVHGADFVRSALDAGAVAVLTDSQGADRVAESGLEVPVLVVDRPRDVLGTACARILGTDDLGLRLVGVTGTNGKTTTAHLAYSALAALGRHPGLIGTVETRIGNERLGSVRTTPEAPELHAVLGVMGERGLDTCVMEVSSHALAQHRVDGVVYDLALFTNLSQDHLDFHPDMEDYFAAKASLFTPEHARAGLVCVDDDWGRRLAEQAGIPVETLGSAPGCTWRVTPSVAEPGSFRLTGPGVHLHLRSSLPGAFNVTNTAMAAAVLVMLGERPADVAEAVLRDPRVPGRMETVVAEAVSAGPRVVVDYAHTPEAIRAALQALRPTTPGSLVCVTGAGGDRDRDKRGAMGAAAAEVADLVVVTDDNPRTEDPSSIRDAVLGGVESVRAAGRDVDVLVVGDRREAIRQAVRRVWGQGPAATVAVVGKGHESGQDVGGVVHPFVDRDEAREALRLAAVGGSA